MLALRPVWLLTAALFTAGLGTTSNAAAVDCLLDGIAATPAAWPDYAPLGAVLAPHCFGTNHQRIGGIERVVFLGDSITVGTPPTATDDFYRNRLADALVLEFGLDAPSLLWRAVDPVNGTTLVRESGDFASCASWGARADDLLGGEQQLASCFPAGTLGLRTLVVITIGGNDVIHLTEDAAGGATPAQLVAARDAFVQEIEAAILWLRAPGRFPNGVSVVLANIYDPTDGSGEVPLLCALLGIEPLLPVDSLVIEAQESLLAIAVANGIDLVFARERFCGHGVNAADASAPCYRGPGTATWIDETCIHPAADGHAALAADFLDTITSAPAPQPVPMLGLGGLVVLATLLAAAVAVSGTRAGGEG